MEILRKPSFTLMSAGALALISVTWGAPPTLDSLRLPVLSARLVAPRVQGSCFAGLSEPDLATRFAASLKTSGRMRLDSSSTSLLRLRMDTADGLCDLSLDYQDGVGQASARATLARGQTVAATDVLYRLASQLTQALAKDRAAVLDVRTTPTGAQVWLSGVEVGKTPAHLEWLRPGSLTLRIGAPGWTEASEILNVSAGQNLAIDRSLARSSQWADSVRHAIAAQHRDSLWKEAQLRPAKDLSELFDRLAQPVESGSRWAVAILPFDVRGPKPDGYDPGVMAAEFGVSRWSGDGRFVLVERAGVNRLLQEQAFAQSGAVSDSGAAQMGKLAAAKFLVTGTVQVTNGMQVFTARMVSVETGELISAATAEKPSADVEAAYREALGEKGQLSSTLYRSLVGPGWGQFYTGHPVHGALALGATVASIGFAVWAWSDYSGKDDILKRYRAGDQSLAIANDVGGNIWTQNAEIARTDRNSAATTFLLSLGAVGVVWAVNLADAAILGEIESTRIRSKYFAFVPTPVVRPEGLALAWRF